MGPLGNSKLFTNSLTELQRCFGWNQFESFRVNVKLSHKVCFVTAAIVILLI